MSTEMLLLLIIIANLVCLVSLIRAIKDSEKRLLSFGYAAGAFLLVIVLGIISMFVLMPARGSVIDTNEVARKIGRAIQVAAPIAAVWGASIPPRRTRV